MVVESYEWKKWQSTRQSELSSGQMLSLRGLRNLLACLVGKTLTLYLQSSHTIRTYRESVKNSQQHLGNARVILCKKYQPCSQATFLLSQQPRNDVIFLMTSPLLQGFWCHLIYNLHSAVCSLQSAVCSLQMSYTEILQPVQRLNSTVMEIGRCKVEFDVKLCQYVGQFWTGHYFRTTLNIGEIRGHFGLQSIDERGVVLA